MARKYCSNIKITIYDYDGATSLEIEIERRGRNNKSPFEVVESHVIGNRNWRKAKRVPGERPHKYHCPICKRFFTVIDIHEGDIPIKCTRCGQKHTKVKLIR